MSGFFNCRRRKLGVFTLFTACVFMAGWVRAQFTELDNHMSFTTFDESRYALFLNPEGIELGKFEITQEGNRQGVSIQLILEIPHWSITIPLTLISLWLLLSKPRKLIQNKTSEPIAKNAA